MLQLMLGENLSMSGDETASCPGELSGSESSFTASTSWLWFSTLSVGSITNQCLKDEMGPKQKEYFITPVFEDYDS